MNDDLDPSTARVWKVSCKGLGRSYFETIFVEYGVAAVGCYGVDEEWTPELNVTEGYKAIPRNLRWSIGALVKMRKDDIVIAADGQRRAVGVGIVAETYGVSKALSTSTVSQGWDLFHLVRVVWQPAEHWFGEKPWPFMRWPAHEVHHAEAIEWARGIASGISTSTSVELPNLPEVELPLPEKQRPNWFVKARQIVEELLESWGWDGFSEASIVAHVLVPMLLDLGWERTQIQLEHNRVDAVLWSGPEKEAMMLVEAKEPRRGVDAALVQVMDYRDRGAREGRWGEHTPVLATSGAHFLLVTKDRIVGVDLRSPTTKAKEFIADLERLSPCSGR